MNQELKKKLTPELLSLILDREVVKIDEIDNNMVSYKWKAPFSA